MPDPLFFDSFLFNGEEIVKMRLAYLDAYVDKFYVTESLYTFSGKKKDAFFIDLHIDWFAPYAHKIHFIKIADKLTHIYFVPTEDANTNAYLTNRIAFEEEKAQRNYVRKVLFKEYPPENPESPKYILAMADVDEFYDLRTLGSKQIVWQACQDRVIFFLQRAYMFNFIYFQKDDWCMAFLINSEMLKNHEDLDHVRVHKLGEKSLVVPSGWHFSYFMSPSEIRRKLQSYSHVDNNTATFTDTEFIKRVILSSQDLFLRKEFPIKITLYQDPANNYPECFKSFYRDVCKAQELPCFL